MVGGSVRRGRSQKEPFPPIGRGPRTVMGNASKPHAHLGIEAARPFEGVHGPRKLAQLPTLEANGPGDDERAHQVKGRRHAKHAAPGKHQERGVGERSPGGNGIPSALERARSSEPSKLG